MNVGELKTTLRAWSHRPALAEPTLEEAIELAQRRILTEVYPQELDQDYQFDETLGVNVRSQVWSLPLPDRCNRVIEVYNNNTRLESVRVGKLIEDWGRQGNAGEPQKHAIVGKDLWLAPGLGGDVRCVFNQWDTDLNVQDPASTNYGLTNFPHLYIWLGLARVETYAQNWDGEAADAARYESERSIYNDVQHARRQGGGVTGMS